MLNEAKEKLTETTEKYVEQLKKIVLASIGGPMLLQDEIEDFLNRCVERGQIAEKDAKKVLKEAKASVADVFKKSKKEGKETISSLESTIDHRIEAILSKMGIPTKEDVNKMNSRLEQVLTKLEKLDEENKDADKDGDKGSKTTKTKTTGK